MRSKWFSGVIVAVAALWPAAASACDFYFLYSPMGQQTGRLALGGGLVISPGDDGGDTGFHPNASLGIRVGERIVVEPAVGYCSEGDEFSEITLGGGAAVSLISNDQWSLGAQVGLSRYSFDGGSEMSIPIVAAATFDVSETARLYAGAGIRMGRFTIDAIDETESDSDPTAFGGITLPVSSLQLSAGLVLVNGDEDTDFSFGAGVQFPLGG